MNNLLEVDEEHENEEVEEGDKKEKKANGAHLSSDAHFQEGISRNGNFQGRELPQSLLINCVNGFKTETCI